MRAAYLSDVPLPTRICMDSSSRPSTLDASAAAAARFASVLLTGEPGEVAAECAAAARDVLDSPVRLVLPTPPTTVEAGDPPEGLVLAARFTVAGSEAELWAAPPANGTPAPPDTAVLDQIRRIWEVQRERAQRVAEVDRLRFELAALQQVARTLTVVRGIEETERLVLDSAGEVFFAWWAALYRARAGDDTMRSRAARMLRGEKMPTAIPIAALRGLTPPGGRPLVPPEDAALRAHLPSDLALAAPLDLGEGATGLLVLGSRISGEQYTTDDVALLGALADSSAVALWNEDLVERLRVQAMVDTLTGCRNRRGFDELLTSEFARARRYYRPLSVILIDIDNFKALNDEHGHDAGDHALRRVGEVLRASFRVTDSACRYGGEEFCIVLPETSWLESMRPAERIRTLVASLFPDDRVPCPITASIGVAAFPDHASDPDELVRAADRALYRAKMGGRNRIETA